MIIKLKDYPALKATIKKAFPGYKKHTAILFEAKSVEPIGTCWDGGSRASYYHIDLYGNHLDSIPAPSAPPQFGGGKPVAFPIDSKSMVCELGTFCGKPATICINANSFLGFDIDYQK